MVVADEAVGVVVHQQDVVTTGKLDKAFEETRCGSGAGGHVGIVQEHHLHAAEIALFESLEVGHPAVFFRQEVVVDHTAGQFDGRCVGGVSGVGHQHLVAGVDVCLTQVAEPLFRTVEGQDFGGRVERDAVSGGVPVGNRLQEHLFAFVVGISVNVSILGSLIEGFNHGGVRGQVGAADTEVDDVVSGTAHGVDLSQFFRKVVFLDLAEPVGHFDLCHGIGCVVGSGWVLALSLGENAWGSGGVIF